ncbi:uncharacterized protein [Pocillopora verrucosa]|uniref:uncharacterized protein isoform X1 n=1 Tax=Pocillopora verrucosa TaxID=203993 RepID=UPI00334223B2
MSFTWICCLLLELCSMIPKTAWSQVVTANSDECRAILFKPVTKDKYLLNHIIKTVPVESEVGCELICYGDPDCVSYNYGPVLSEIPLCDLNNSTHLQVTSVNFITRNGFSYRGIENPCGSSPCQKNSTCQAGFTSKGYRCVCPQGLGVENCDQVILPQNCSQAVKETGVYEISNHGSDSFPVYCDQTSDGGGWTMVFKLVSGLSPLDVGGIWSSPSLYHENLNETFDLTSAYPTHYKNRIVLNWKNFNPKEVRVVIYKDSQQVTSLKFNATNTDNLNWFSHENLIYSPWSDLKMFPSVNFGLLGPIVSDRFFEITGPYTGCESDIGWLVVTSHPVCPWDRRSPRPSIQYSKQRMASRMENYGNVGIADVLAVFVR